jgi:tRNA pseudouridine38-40 synthase
MDTHGPLSISMGRFRLVIEYEGTRYRGWQVQKNARSVQGELMRAIQDICQTAEYEFHGAGRTDAGVHALGQVAHLEVRTMLAPEILRMKLNDILPADINVLSVDKAAANFHARHHAVSRSYLYQISRRRTALGKRYVWWIKDPLEAPHMVEALELFKGMKDFRSFAEEDPERPSTKVLIEELRLEEHGDLILFRVRGSHFIWKMVRRMVGVLAGVGRGSLTMNDIKSFLNEQSDTPARLTAPPSGLFLERVYYPGDSVLTSLQPVLLVNHG